ncbi:MAG: TolB family protein [Planctomycetota bacterium]
MASPSAAQVTQRVTVGSGGIQGNQICYAPSSISADGRFLLFDSRATNLVPGDTNNYQDVFVRDRVAGTLQRVNVGPGGVQTNNRSGGAAMTPDGRFVLFTSEASNLVPGDTNGSWDVFIRDRVLGTTERVSVSSSGAEADAALHASSISPDGRYVVFSGSATNLVAGDTNGHEDVFLRDRLNQTTERLSLASNEAQASGGPSYNGSVSDDGRYVAFVSLASNLAPADTNGAVDVFLRDRTAGTTERVTVGANPPPPGVLSWADGVQISGNGRFVAFSHDANNLVPGDTNGVPDIFVRNLALGTTERVSVSTAGGQGNDRCFVMPSISSNGRYVAFGSYATNLVAGDTNVTQDVFLRDRQLGTTERISLGASGEQLSWNSSSGCVSPDGRFVTFANFLNFLPDDSNDLLDGFVRDRVGGTSFTSLCDPGVGGVMPCPCLNPPIGPGRGCNNSGLTGGAILSATGGTFLTSDSLVFTTSGQRPATLSIVSQWSSPAAAGITFGQGVRCATGALRRLYVKSAEGGSITAPDYTVGDPPVSVRSASAGDTISAGQSRWYIVYYRDAVVLGGCPAASTFNATQTGVVSWAP